MVSRATSNVDFSSASVEIRRKFLLGARQHPQSSQREDATLAGPRGIARERPQLLASFAELRLVLDVLGATRSRTDVARAVAETLAAMNTAAFFAERRERADF